MEIINILNDFYRLHHFVLLTADVMFVNGVPFLVTLFRKIGLRTTEHIQTCTAKLLSSSLIKVVKMYTRGGFIVNIILMDQKINKLELKLDIVEINTTAAREHIGKIEQNIRTIKERARAIVTILPCGILPKQLVILLVYFVVMFINCLSAAKGISEKYLIGKPC